MDAISETRLKDIHLILADRSGNSRTSWKPKNITIRATCGLRS